LENADYESMWLETKINHKNEIFALYIIGVHHNQLQLGTNLFSHLNTSVNIATRDRGTVIIGGDFNCRSKMWWMEDINSTEKLYEASINNSLSQLIHEPTRITPTSKILS
jgi:endonuclease/exonuclease/phosphatase (EEP) superfamily protein YafD